MEWTTARVLTLGEGQVVVLPKELTLDTDEVLIRRIGASLVIMPHRTSWEGFKEGFTGLSDDFRVDGDLASDTPRDM